MPLEEFRDHLFKGASRRRIHTGGSSSSLHTRPRFPGFDPDDYLKLNADVAAAYASESNPTAAVTKHFETYGAAEMRRVKLDGNGIVSPDTRLLPVDGHDGWLMAVRELAAQRKTTVAALIEKHPRSGWLWTGFNPYTYAVSRKWLLEQTSDWAEISAHFLEFGLDEGQYGRPKEWDPALVKSLYHIEPEIGKDAVIVLATIRKKFKRLSLPLTEAEYLAEQGITADQLASLFDHEFYHAMAAQKCGPAMAGLPSTDRFGCIRHFCEVGSNLCLPIHPELAFDAAFYQEAYSAHIDRDTKDPFGLNAKVSAGTDLAPALYLHWLKYGANWGWAPNLRVFAQNEFGIKPPLAFLKQLPRFVLGDSQLSVKSTDVEIIQRLSKAPRPGFSWLDLRETELQSFVIGLADRAAVANDIPLAQWLYWLIIEANPHNLSAVQKLADVQQRAGKTNSATTLRKSIPPSRESAWNVLNLAELYIARGRYNDAAQLLASQYKGMRSDVVQRQKCVSLAKQTFWAIWNNITQYVNIYGVAETQNHLRMALKACSPVMNEFGASRADKIRRVALVGNEDLYQCKLYRIDQKADQLRAAGFEVQIYSPSRQLHQFKAELNRFEAVIFFRVPAFPDMIDVITAAADYGLATFYEIDDIVFDTEHFPPSFESYANQISREHYNAMACGVPLFEHAMSLCDYGIASTATIRELMAKKVRSGQAFEHHNALGNLHLLAVDTAARRVILKPDGAPVVIFYGSGTKAHKEEFHDILEPALAEMLRRFPKKVEIRLVGNFDSFKHLDPEKDPVTLLSPVWDFEEYCEMLAQADINLSILSPSVLTDAKSEIKWMEAAMFGIPSVVSATATHRETILDGETGILCETTAEFAKALAALIADPNLRRRIGTAAKDVVNRDYAIKTLGQNLGQIFDEVRPAIAPKTRLLIVNVFYPPQAIGGATRVVHDNVTILKNLYGDRFEIDVICTLEGGQVPYEVGVYAADGVRVWAISTPHDSAIDTKARNPEMGNIFASILDQVRPDLIHFHCIQRLTAEIAETARVKRIPYVITMHDAWWISPNQFVLDHKGKSAFYDYTAQTFDSLPERARALRKPLLGAERLLSVSDAFAELHRKVGLERVMTIENGVSHLPVAPRSPSQSGRVRLAHIGGASMHKGYHHVRNALMANSYKNLELLVIDHALSPGVVLHETWGTTPVTFRGKVSQSNVAELYVQIDVLLAPSTWPESYGLVTREALAAGAWVIASDRGAIGSSIIEGENGHIVDVTSYEGVARALATVDAHPDTYRVSPTTVSPLREVTAQVADLVDLYEEIARKR